MLTEYEQKFLQNGQYDWNFRLKGRKKNFTQDLYCSWAIILFVYDKNIKMPKPDETLKKHLRRIFERWEFRGDPKFKRSLLYRAHLICNDMFLKRFIALAIILSYNPRHEYADDKRLELITNEHNISRKEVNEYHA